MSYNSTGRQQKSYQLFNWTCKTKSY